ncbi:TraR/DksA family transcriptional regulator [Halorhodospira halophila]|uniref:Transcriptional regulator, TraR/DksA family n=1 Tax=Halorhodospira halophila (strain DSM 244 / SL1) TaxID=349124 RepID=A1WYH9_HALHL|nr:TraR/DksA C4-type zinc finger protein [Halorhodospira halophila]ABM62741.1 transcriptional regulator, TraR/DksA family [Halorhodospira halophila SL1]MBK1728136.1 conjugal transfer protein TraR [Halorhodospira halophila]
MTDEQTETFRQQLLALREETVAAAESARAATATVELDQTRQGRLSRMDALQGQQMALERERRRQHLVQRIDGALRRLDSGDFGYCFICGEDIDPRRLQADPTLTRCAECAA